MPVAGFSFRDLRSNQSLERTGLGSCGSLRSVAAVLARRSAQVR